MLLEDQGLIEIEFTGMSFFQCLYPLPILSLSHSLNEKFVQLEVDVDAWRKVYAG